jgi:3-keto-5-aminohexanoate cleavage enzyme|tara:strand:- start:11 stop:811 length:801 start_codon:yes stop_codon:yes gene_type:complete
MIMVAPNGARRNQQDHHGLPMTIEQTVAAALTCQQAGASILHAHIRDKQGKHSLDAGMYEELLDEMANQVPEMLVQITTEAVGQYSTQQQMDLVTKLRPKMASVALRELVPTVASEVDAKHFFSWADEAQVHLQIILYDAADLQRLNQLQVAGVLPNNSSCVLYVLGRYRENLQAQHTDLDEFMQPKNLHTWFACAFGQQEHACITYAIDQGGHARVGFENNLWLPSGELAANNHALVAQVASYAQSQLRQVASAREAQLILGVRD